jgi:hypothetical protein
MAVQFGFFIGPFVVGWLVLLFSIPLLCCCCYSCCCCCNKNKENREPYSKCELYWPSIVLLIALLLIVGSSIVGLIKATDIQHSYEAIFCSVATAFNDIINGSPLSGGNFFVGL